MQSDMMDMVDLTGYIAETSDKTKTLSLEYPIILSVKENNEARDEVLSELVMRRPRIKDLEILEGKKNAKSVTVGLDFAAALIVEPQGLPRKRLDELDGDDGLRVMACAMSFLSITNSRVGEMDESD